MNNRTSNANLRTHEILILNRSRWGMIGAAAFALQGIVATLLISVIMDKPMTDGLRSTTGDPLLVEYNTINFRLIAYLCLPYLAVMHLILLWAFYDVWRLQSSAYHNPPSLPAPAPSPPFGAAAPGTPTL